MSHGRHGRRHAVQHGQHGRSNDSTIFNKGIPSIIGISLLASSSMPLLSYVNRSMYLDKGAATSAIRRNQGSIVSRGAIRDDLTLSVSVPLNGDNEVKNSYVENIIIPYSPAPWERVEKNMEAQVKQDEVRVKTALTNNDYDFTTGYNPSLTRDMAEDLNKQYDQSSSHDGYAPGHDSGDHGSTYEFSQCTWWVYLRRVQLGLPVGSYMGDGHMWADSARSLGYWVDRSPHIGDVMVFQRGQLGASSKYGHVAIVEDVVTVDGDKYVVTSEEGASFNGVPFSRVIGQVNDYEYIHF